MHLGCISKSTQKLLTNEWMKDIWALVPKSWFLTNIIWLEEPESSCIKNCSLTRVENTYIHTHAHTDIYIWSA